MVATRALLQANQPEEPGVELRRCLRDIVALSGLPGIWIKADAKQVANSLAQLVVSVLDADVACVILGNPAVNIVQCHNRASGVAFDSRSLKLEWRKANSNFEFHDSSDGRLHGFTVPIGKEPDSILTALCRRPGFPTETEQLLLRVAASQAAVTIQRWQTEQSLRSEIARREALERDQSRLLAQVRENEHRIRELLDAVPAAIYTTDLDGSVLMFNRAAANLCGREPVAGKDKWCVSWRLYHPDGRPLPHEECPMAVTLKEGRAVRGVEIVAERPDGTRIPVMPFPTPLHDAEGKCVGSVNMLIDISELKGARDAVERRMEEQAALYRFTDSLYRAQHTSEVYEAALDAILQALRCSRASILLFDDKGSMRFVAWRGLSEKYRAAVDGHSPWSADSKDPNHICLGSIENAEVEDWLKDTVKAEGIAALSFVPLVAGGRLIGKFMTYYDAPHEFSQHDTGLAVTIARHLGFAIEQNRLKNAGRIAEQSLRQSESRKAAILESALDAIVALDQSQLIVDFNPSAERVFGVVSGDVLGKSFIGTIIPERFRHGIDAGLRQFLESGGGDLVGRCIEMPVLRSDGSEFDSEFTIAAARPGEGDARFIVCLRDVTERKRAEAQRELLVAELNHRVKNTLATVIAIGHQSFSKGKSPEEAWHSFDDRVRALAQTHSRLAESHWSNVFLEALIRDETAPYRSSGNDIRINGPEIALGPKRAISIGMAIHELTTNAAKYGALSMKNGCLEISWEIADSDREVRLNWVETGGPVVCPPHRAGFGQFLLQRALASDLNGKVELEFAKEGVKCLISFPIEGDIIVAGGNAHQIEPVAGVQASRSDEDRSIEQTSSNGARILVVEDEFFLAIEIQDSLRSDGYTVVGPYHDLAQATQAARREVIDLAVLDTNLNGELVYPLADELMGRGIPCIFATGYGASNLPERFRHSRRLAKPYHPNAVPAEIRNVLGSTSLAAPVRKVQTDGATGHIRLNSSVQTK